MFTSTSYLFFSYSLEVIGSLWFCGRFCITTTVRLKLNLKKGIPTKFNLLFFFIKSINNSFVV